MHDTSRRLDLSGPQEVGCQRDDAVEGIRRAAEVADTQEK
jgi:hypothetical protein